MFEWQHVFLTVQVHHYSLLSKWHGRRRLNSFSCSRYEKFQWNIKCSLSWFVSNINWCTNTYSIATCTRTHARTHARTQKRKVKWRMQVKWVDGNIIDNIAILVYGSFSKFRIRRARLTSHWSWRWEVWFLSWSPWTTRCSWTWQKLLWPCQSWLWHLCPCPPVGQLHSQGRWRNPLPWWALHRLWLVCWQWLAVHLGMPFQNQIKKSRDRRNVESPLGRIK